MLSILIPAYDYSVFPLAQLLEEEALQLNIPFELICMDDGSFSAINKINQKINTLTHCKFIEYKKNRGRTATRQALAHSAQYDWLLFLDADTIPKHTQFLQHYLNELNTSNFDVLFGGFAYDNNSFVPHNSLRFTFGKYREEIAASIRLKTPYKIIISANMLIKKELFLKCITVETQNMYGLDYLFGSLLKNSNAIVKHIDNEVYHYGVDSNTSFLNKTKQALNSLSYLLKQHKIKANDISLLKAYSFLRALKLNHLFGRFMLFFNTKIEAGLMKESPSLLLFDLYRLGYFCRIH